MMIKEINKETCTGCGVCVAVCPKHCIKMEPDEYGFQYPVVDDRLCINCNLCVKNCHALHVKENDDYIPVTFAAYSRNESIRKSSSSGGVFYSLAKYILSKNGVIYGVVLNSENIVIHDRATTFEQLVPMLGSKYVQSKLDEKIFHQIKFDLDNGKMVLFTGTPCQCGAIKQFTKNTNTSKLYIVSFICHGVPSPLVWSEYIKWQMDKNNSEIESISFRDKTLGWSRFSMSIKFKNGNNYLKPLDKDYYLKAFLKNNCLRESCYQCQYKGKEHYIDIDIMLADWWGAESSELMTKSANKGISAVFINSKKGIQLWQNIEKGMYTQKISFINASTSNIAYNYSANEGKNKAEFMRDIKNIRFDKLVKMYCKTPLWFSLKKNSIKAIYWFAKATGTLKIYKKLRNL